VAKITTQGNKVRVPMSYHVSKERSSFSLEKLKNKNVKKNKERSKVKKKKSKVKGK